MAKFAKITYGTQGQSKEYTYVVNDNVRVGSFIEPAFKHFPDGKICSTIGIVQSTAKEATAKGKQFKEELGGKDVVKTYTGKELGIDKENISEKVLQGLILEDIPSFLKELGEGYSFIENEYKIRIGNTYNYIDLLLFNIKYNCYVVVELKVTEIKKEHIGQIQIYMNYIDKHIKGITNNKTIGIIVARRDNHYYIEYSSDERIYTRNYEIV